jgi:hypothetical protein
MNIFDDKYFPNNEASRNLFKSLGYNQPSPDIFSNILGSRIFYTVTGAGERGPDSGSLYSATIVGTMTRKNEIHLELSNGKSIWIKFGSDNVNIGLHLGNVGDVIEVTQLRYK